MRFAIASFIVLQAYGQTAPDAATLIKQSKNALAGYRSYQIVQEMTMDGTPMAGFTMTTTASIVNPNKLRMEVKTAGIDAALTVSDGTNGWMYMPAFKQYAKVPPDSPDMYEMMGGFAMSPGLSDADEAHSKVTGSEVLEVDGQLHDCWVIESRMDKAGDAGPAQMTDMVYTYWIDKTLGFGLKMSMSGKTKVGNSAPISTRTVTTTRSLKLNVDLPDSLFVFTPPADAKENSDLINEVGAISGGGSSGAEAVAPAAAKPKMPEPGEPEAFIPLLNPAERIEPAYPPEARAKGLQGMVDVLVTVDSTGTVVHQEPLSGPAELRGAAMDAVQQWRFRPVYRNGHPVAAYTTEMVDFYVPGAPKNPADLNMSLSEEMAATQKTQDLNARFPRSAEQVLADAEDQIRDADTESRFYALADIAREAMDAGAVDKASSYATELLKMAADNQDDWNYGNAVFTGNMVLGLVALRQGSVAQARLYLLESGKTKGSPQLDSFGPDFTLARELLRQGERDAVVDFLAACKSFWKLGLDRLDQMIAAVKSGDGF